MAPSKRPSERSCLVGLPLSIGGVLGTLYATGHAMGLTPLIAILMLMAISAKNPFSLWSMPSSQLLTAVGGSNR